MNFDKGYLNLIIVSIPDASASGLFPVIQLPELEGTGVAYHGTIVTAVFVGVAG